MRHRRPVFPPTHIVRTMLALFPARSTKSSVIRRDPRFRSALVSFTCAVRGRAEPQVLA